MHAGALLLNWFIVRPLVVVLSEACRCQDLREGRGLQELSCLPFHPALLPVWAMWLLCGLSGACMRHTGPA